MLTDGFYNLTTAKGLPTIKVEKNFGGISITFTDEPGDELQIVLKPKSLKELIDRAGKSMAGR